MKSIVKLKINLKMKKLFILLTLVSVFGCQGQTKKVAEKQNTEVKTEKVEITEDIRQKEYDLFKSYFKKEIKLPAVFFKIEDVITKKYDTLSRKLYNKIVFDNQQKNGKQVYAKIYDENKNTKEFELVELKQHYNYYSDLSATDLEFYHHIEKKDYDLKFVESIYPVGMIKLNDLYDVFVIKHVHIDVAWIDLFVFDKKGNIKSFVKLFDREILREQSKDIESFIFEYKNYDDVGKYVESKIENDQIIKVYEAQYGLNIWTGWQLQPDGYFKLISFKEEGKNDFDDYGDD